MVVGDYPTLEDERNSSAMPADTEEVIRIFRTIY